MTTHKLKIIGTTNISNDINYNRFFPLLSLFNKKNKNIINKNTDIFLKENKFIKNNVLIEKIDLLKRFKIEELDLYKYHFYIIKNKLINEEIDTDILKDLISLSSIKKDILFFRLVKYNHELFRVQMNLNNEHNIFFDYSFSFFPQYFNTSVYENIFLLMIPKKYQEELVIKESIEKKENLIYKNKLKNVSPRYPK